MGHNKGRAPPHHSAHVWTWPIPQATSTFYGTKAFSIARNGCSWSQKRYGRILTLSCNILIGAPGSVLAEPHCSRDLLAPTLSGFCTRPLARIGYQAADRDHLWRHTRSSTNRYADRICGDGILLDPTPDTQPILEYADSISRTNDIVTRLPDIDVGRVLRIHCSDNPMIALCTTLSLRA
jgi:hypothetical protein